jgi:hypothetical protein
LYEISKPEISEINETQELVRDIDRSNWNSGAIKNGEHISDAILSQF